MGLTIIIPTLNEENNLSELLLGLNRLKQVQVIVSDGGSSDNTQKIAMLYGAKFICGALGRGQQLNLGAEAAKTEILLFLHADSRIKFDLLAEIIEVVHQGALWGCAKIAFDRDSTFYRCLAWSSNWRARVLSSCYGDQGIFCVKDFFDQIGGFSPWPLFEDVDFSHRARKIRKAYVLNNTVLSSSRRFEKQGRLRTWLIMQKLKLLYFTGTSPDKLAAIYRR